LRFLQSSIGQKIVMAVTGIILSVFVLGHMLGNLKVFEGADALNAYGRLLRFEPALLWTVRLGLLAAVGLHIWAHLALSRTNMSARRQPYRVSVHRESSYASRSMRLTGPLLLGFIIYHLLHLTTGTVHPSFKEGDVYHNVVAGLSVVPVALVYLVAMACLGVHLWHGVWSLFQTLGASQARHGSVGRRVATIFTLVVIIGFAAVPLSIVTGLVK
jgi:succinate dehydrogenase / fumarate reductase cytochrome b subunit